MPSLDGLRAISIGLVILGHLSGTRGFGSYRNLEIGDYSRFGVIVFFVISGFLITSLLISEHEINGRVSLKLFYLRRSLRIFPAAYAYVFVVLLLGLGGVIHLRSSDPWVALTYTANYVPVSWQFVHLWSLSVEEQFYLLWPLAFVGLGPRRATWAAAGVIVFAIFARAANRLFLIGTPYDGLPYFPMVADSLAMGCLLARLRSWLEEQGWYLRLFQPVWSLLVLVLVLLINRYQGYTVVSVFGTVIMNAGLAFLIHRSVYHANDWMGWFLNWKPIAFAGALSYSLYLWQQLFISRYSGAWVNAFPQNLVLSVAAAMASFFLIERPLLGLRHRLRVRSHGEVTTAGRPQELV
jgi:peptidoglycan/LPS O-acetylase OafA/YrhL